MYQWSRNAEGYQQREETDGVTILARGRWEQVQEAIGAGAGWMCQEQVQRAMVSGRCTGGWFGGIRDDMGVTLGVAVGIVNGVEGRAPLERKRGATLDLMRGAPLGKQWSSPLDLGLVWERPTLDLWQVWVHQLGADRSGEDATPQWGPREVADVGPRQWIPTYQPVL